MSDRLQEDFRISAIYSGLKRCAELGLILLGLPILVPVTLFTATVIRVSSAGPVLFVQERIGRGGVPFNMYKFRSMRNDAENKGPQFADRGDNRITRVGKLVRQFRLDELPQIWNVFIGDMSLIGPRPEQVLFADKFSEDIPYYSYRHMVRPGITGWAQVHQGYAEAAETREKLEFDLYYIKYLSFWLDVLIVFKTIKTILTGFGAR